MSTIGQLMADGFEDFARKLASNEPIPVAILTRESTPDGPLTHRHEVTLRPSELRWTCIELVRRIPQDLDGPTDAAIAAAVAFLERLRDSGTERPPTLILRHESGLCIDRHDMLSPGQGLIWSATFSGDGKGELSRWKDGRILAIEDIPGSSER